jgi:hypothetical protein
MLVAVIFGLPLAILADSFEASTHPDRDARIRTYVACVAVLVALDLLALRVAWRRRRDRKPGSGSR